MNALLEGADPMCFLTTGSGLLCSLNRRRDKKWQEGAGRLRCSFPRDQCRLESLTQPATSLPNPNLSEGKGIAPLICGATQAAALQIVDSGYNSNVAGDPDADVAKFDVGCSAGAAAGIGKPRGTVQQ